MNTKLTMTAAACVCALTTIALAQNAPPSPAPAAAPAQGTPALPGDDVPSSSLLVTTPLTVNPRNEKEYEPHALRDVSMFAITPPKPREFEVHDLVQIIVRETSSAISSQELETSKEGSMESKLTDWPAYSWADFVLAGANDQLPEFGMEFTNEFTGEGDYARKDDLTARISAEVIEVLPNGNLVLEARTWIKTDKEEQSMKVTGICRPEDITGINTINSNQIHDLVVDKIHKGELKEAAKKGLFTKVLETLFAF